MKKNRKKVMKSVMGKGLAVSLAAAAIGCSLTGCGFDRGLSQSTTNLTEKYHGENPGVDIVEAQGEKTPITEEFQKSYIDFSLELLRESRKLAAGTSEAGNYVADEETVEKSEADVKTDDSLRTGANTMVSPLSAMMALEMTRSGARTETAREMETVLYQEIFAEDGKRELLAFAAGLPDSEKARFHLANSIWFHTGDTAFVPDEDFLENAAKDYAAEIYGAPFDESTCADINKWVEQETDGMIKDILDEIPLEAIMYLVNALAFEAEWADVYETNQVHDAKFYPADGSEQKISMMYSEEGIYLQDAHAAGFMKPYATGYEFVALLPNEGMTLTEYLGGLTGEDLMETLDRAETTLVSTGIPKFKSETSVELSDALKNMGMPLAFDEKKADFSGMGRMGEFEAETPGIWINRVLHKTYIEVDELGTKAGAATVVEMAAEGCALYEKEPVILDRPFLYAIVDTETKLPIFIGTMETADGR